MYHMNKVAVKYLVLLWKESLNSDDFHFQQNNQPPLALTHWTPNMGSTTYDIGNPEPGLRQTHKYGGVKPANGIPTQHW